MMRITPKKEYFAYREFMEGRPQEDGSQTPLKTAYEMAVALAGIVDVHVPSDLEEREVSVAINRSYYGYPSSVAIDFEGSPARFPIYVSDLKGNPWYPRVVVNNKIPRNPDKCMNVAAIVKAFLVRNGYCTQEDLA